MLQEFYKASPHPDVVTTSLENGEMVLLHLGTRQYYSLNQTASIVWQLMEGRSTLATIGLTLHNRFDIAAGAAQESVFELIEQLSVDNLVTIEVS
jgi:hypothetical protein